MTQPPGHRDLRTHSVENQPGGLRTDLWVHDPAFRDHVLRHGGRKSVLERAGTLLVGADLRQAAEDARRDPPRLVTHDRTGARIDEVRFNAGYHRLIETGLELGYASVPWDGSAGGHVTHAGLVYLMSQVEPGVCCPMTMTYAAIPALAADAALLDAWRPKLASARYDPAIAPVGLCL